MDDVEVNNLVVLVKTLEVPFLHLSSHHTSCVDSQVALMCVLIVLVLELPSPAYN